MLLGKCSFTASTLCDLNSHSDIPSRATCLKSAVDGLLLCRCFRRAWLACVLIALLACVRLAPAQQTGPTPQKPAVVPKQQPQTPDHRISSEEAKELLSAVDEILKFDSNDTGLKIKHQVKRELVSRDHVQKYIQSRLEDDEDTQRLRNSEAVLKKLGLLPREFDLEKFLVELLREQVAGYYDTKTKTVYLLDWLQPEAQLPVMAHELTHALQDQNYGMEQWVGKGTSDKSPTEEARSDEEIAARHAVIEGQAMAVMINYLLAPTGNNIVNSPTITEAIQQGMMEGGDSPVFERAPIFLKRTLLFPYRYGLDFERELLIKGGKEKAFAGVFKNPPQNTRQVMEPATYLAGEKLPEMQIPDIPKILGGDWEKYDVGSIGEFDIAVMAEVYGSDDPKKIYPNWRGGWYYALKKKSGGELGLVMVTKWASADSASQFRQAYETSIPKRYTVKPGVPGAALGGVTGGPTSGWKQWDTTEGLVRLSSSGDLVVSIESFPQELIEALSKAAIGK